MLQQLMSFMFNRIINQAVDNFKKIFFFLFVFVFFISVNAQVSPQIPALSSKLTKKYFKKIDKKVLILDKTTTKRTRKSFKKFQRQQHQLHKKLCKINPELADRLFSYQVDPLYYQKDPFNLSPHTRLKDGPKEYNPYLDTLKCSSSFFSKTQSDSSMSSLAAETNKNVLNCDSKLERANKIQHYMRQRKILLNKSLKDYPSLKKDLLGIDKINYYYGQYLKEFKNRLKIESKFESLFKKGLSSNPDFSKFMSANGAISKFSKIPANWGKSTKGLQTNADVEKMLEESTKTLSGLLSKDEIVAKVKEGTDAISKMKSGNYGNATNAADVPGFKPNPMKTKRFIDRLEYGTDIQFKKTSTYFPATGNFGLQIGYKFTPKFSIGTGGTYVLGLGRDWDKIHFSQEGIGIRTYSDYQLKGSIFLSAGYEKNATMPTATQKEQGHNSFNWYASALIGLKIKPKVFGKATPTLSLQYDFLHDEHAPSSPAFVYRVGWALK
jgi:hypothetical protein